MRPQIAFLSRTGYLLWTPSIHHVCSKKVWTVLRILSIKTYHLYINNPYISRKTGAWPRKAPRECTVWWRPYLTKPLLETLLSNSSVRFIVRTRDCLVGYRRPDFQKLEALLSNSSDRFILRTEDFAFEFPSRFYHWDQILCCWTLQSDWSLGLETLLSNSSNLSLKTRDCRILQIYHKTRDFCRILHIYHLREIVVEIFRLFIT